MHVDGLPARASRTHAQEQGLSLGLKYHLTLLLIACVRNCVW